MSCQNNMHNLALGMMNHESAHQHFPTGGLYPLTPVDHPDGERKNRVDWFSQLDNNPCTGHMAYILPFIEQAAIYEPFKRKQDLNYRIGGDLTLWVKDGRQTTSPSVDRTRPWWWDDELWTTAQYRIGTFICPSDDPYEQNQGVFFVPLAAAGQRGGNGVQGFYGIYFPQPWNVLGLTNYLGVAGRFGTVDSTGADPAPFLNTRGQLVNADYYKGMFANHRVYQMKHLIDGSSNILMLGEVTGDFGNAATLTNRTRSLAWISSHMPLHYVTRATSGVAYNRDARWYRNSSKHGDMWQWAMADASVKALSYQIDPDTLLQLGGIQDGESFSQDKVGQ
jgi:hypothetical protein